MSIVDFKVKTFIESADLNRLKNDTLRNINEAMLHGWTNDDGTHYQVWIETLVSGRYGQYQDEKMAEIFGIDFDKNDKEFLWDEIYQFADKVADELNQLIDMKGSYYFWHHESDGDYGLLYQEEIEEEKQG